MLADLDAVLGGPKPREVAVEHRVRPMLSQGSSQRDGPGAAEPRDLPGRRVRRNGLEVAVAQQHGGRGLRAPARQSRVAVGGIADDGQVVRDRGRAHAPLRAHAGVVVDQPAAAVPEHDPLALDELGHVLVGRADEDPLDLRIVGESNGRRGDRVVGLELDHRPQRTIPRASTAASAIGNWASSSGGMPADDL